MQRPFPVRRALRSSRGFTLIEVLAVIIILAILVALLVPALQGAMTRARVTQVRAEISSLEAAISRFNADFNMDPPSSIILCEKATDWANTGNPNIVRSRALIRQMWPQFDFTYSGYPNQQYDINQDGTPGNGPWALAGAECLVFFLGGLVDNSSGKPVMTGFSKNPANPFATGGNRQGPYFEFLGTRLTPAWSGSTGNVNFYGYLDPLPSQTKPYVYLSSYAGQGYRISDLGTNGLISWYLQIPAPTYSAAGAIDPTKKTAWHAKRFQIISAGMDQAYGTGGPYDPSNSNTPLPLWFDSNPPSWATSTPPYDAKDRTDDKDNITNFANGTLGSGS